MSKIVNRFVITSIMSYKSTINMKDLMMRKVTALQCLVKIMHIHKRANLQSLLKIVSNNTVATLQCLVKMSLLSQYIEVNMGQAFLAITLNCVKFVGD